MTNESKNFKTSNKNKVLIQTNLKLFRKSFFFKRTRTQTMNESFYVSTKHKTLAFSAAHFICHDEWREFIHGHNYRVGLSLEGIDRIFLHIIMLLASKIDSKTGYIVDFKDIEAPLKEIVENFKGKLIVPTLSKSLTHSDDGTSITLM